MVVRSSGWRDDGGPVQRVRQPAANVRHTLGHFQTIPRSVSSANGRKHCGPRPHLANFDVAGKWPPRNPVHSQRGNLRRERAFRWPWPGKAPPNASSRRSPERAPRAQASCHRPRRARNRKPECWDVRSFDLLLHHAHCEFHQTNDIIALHGAHLQGAPLALPFARPFGTVCRFMLSAIAARIIRNPRAAKFQGPSASTMLTHLRGPLLKIRLRRSTTKPEARGQEQNSALCRRPRRGSERAPRGSRLPEPRKSCGGPVGDQAALSRPLRVFDTPPKKHCAGGLPFKKSVANVEAVRLFRVGRY